MRKSAITKKTDRKNQNGKRVQGVDYFEDDEVPDETTKVLNVEASGFDNTNALYEGAYR